MNHITLRFSHDPSRTPVMEVNELDPNTTTVSELKDLLIQRFANDDRLPMRAFAKWYLRMDVGGAQRPFEISQVHAGLTLAEMGIVDDSPVFLEGPLMGDFDGVGQAVGLLNAQLHNHMHDNHALLQQIVVTNALQQQALASIAAMQQTLITQQLQQTNKSQVLSLLNEAKDEYRALRQREDEAFDQIIHTIGAKSALAYLESTKGYFFIDPNTPHPYTIVDSYTATKYLGNQCLSPTTTCVG